MKISKEELQKALDIVKPGLASRELLAQTTSFAFQRGRVTTYNDEISISCPVQGSDEIEGAVLAENLYKFLTKVSKDEMDIIVEDNEIVLSIGKAKAGLNFFSEVTLPLEEELQNKGKYTKLPKDFCKAVAFVMTASGTSLNEPLLTCVHVSESGYAEASDGYRIARHNIVDETPIAEMLVPARSMAEIVKLNPTRVAKGNGWLHFRNKEGVEISCRILNEDKYMNVNPLLLVKGTKVILPEKLEEVLARASIFAKRENILEEEVHITIESKTLTMEASSESGWFEEEANMVNYKGEPKRITIPPYLLKEILKETRACEISTNQIKFEGEQWVYVSQLKTNGKKR
jgi:hypothetical protein